jgi:hypothetical protein
VHPDDSKNVLAMEACSAADNQQWYVERPSDVPRLTRMTNRDTGATRCLEAMQQPPERPPLAQQCRADDVRSYLTSSSSTSKIKFEFGGIGPAPCSP